VYYFYISSPRLHALLIKNYTANFLLKILGKLCHKVGEGGDMGSRTFTLGAEILVWNGADKTHRKFLLNALQCHFILEKLVSSSEAFYLHV
jgi:hypothetical protein